MSSKREIRAAYDEEGIYVYQAFKPSIVAAALERGTFGTGFKMERMTWIKPSFGWMLYRSGYGTKPDQEAVLRIKLSHEGFREILGQGVLSDYHPDVHPDRDAWQEAVRRSPVRIQWDPDRTLRLEKLDRRAIQIGLRGWVVRRYVHEWIIGLEEVTALAHAIREQVKSGGMVPEERIYPVSAAVRQRLGMGEPHEEQEQ